LRDHLLAYGWDIVVVDIQWYEPTARAHGYNPAPPVVLDGHGRPLPAPDRFPSGRASAPSRPDGADAPDPRGHR
jgi:alpha-galactosidase